jgi:hypothetical protein
LLLAELITKAKRRLGTLLKNAKACRLGALLKEFDARGDHRKSTLEGTSSKTQREAAEESGMSPGQQKQAVRVNNVRDQFEATAADCATRASTMLSK